MYGAKLGMGGTNIQIRIMQESVWPTPRTPHRVQVCVRSTIDFLLIPGQMELLSTAPPYLINVPWYWLSMDTNTTWSPISTPQQCRTKTWGFVWTEWKTLSLISFIMLTLCSLLFFAFGFLKKEFSLEIATVEHCTFQQSKHTGKLSWASSIFPVRYGVLSRQVQVDSRPPPTCRIPIE